MDEKYLDLAYDYRATLKNNGKIKAVGMTNLIPGAYYGLLNDGAGFEHSTPLLYCGQNMYTGMYIFKEKSADDSKIDFSKVITSLPGAKFIEYNREASRFGWSKGLESFTICQITDIKDQTAKYFKHQHEYGPIIFTGGRRKMQRTRQNRQRQRKSTRKMRH